MSQDINRHEMLISCSGLFENIVACKYLVFKNCIIKIEDDHVNIEIHEILKTSKPGKYLPPLSFPAFVEEPRLCIVTVLKEYIQRTEKLRKSQKLFVTYTKPYNQPAISTLSNWIKLVLQLAGVNVKLLFKTHSTRLASTPLR